MASPVPSPLEAPAEGSRDGRDSPRRRLALTTGQRLKQMNQHHPYRIELLDLTPVSVSVLWSTRPPPLSAIPSGIISTPLRQRFQARTLPNGNSSPAPSATASAVSTLPSAPAVNVTAAKLPHSRYPPLSSETSSNAGSARASPIPGSSHDVPIHRLAEGLVATRSLNRKVTKIRLRGPSSASPAPGRRVSNDAATFEPKARPNDDDGLVSDDATSGFDEDGASGSEGSDSGFEGDPRASNMVHVFEKRVSVTVNGNDWPHVLMGERGSHEAIVVIFGLQPESDYDIQFEVKVGLDGTLESLRLPIAAKAERGDRGVVSAVIGGSTAATVRPGSPSPLGKAGVSTDNGSGVINVQRKALLQAELETSEALKSEMLAELRKARKETSKAESALRHEIESIKRHIDRMSSTDHRSKQKVLALQEAIKQTSAHVKEIHNDAEEIEGEQDDWIKQEAEVVRKLEELRKEVDDEDAEVEAQLQSDEAEIAAVEKELKTVEASVRSKKTDRDSLQSDKIPSLEAEIAKLQSQIKDLLSKPLHARRGGHASGRGGGRGGSGSNHMVPSQVLPRGKGPQGLGYSSGSGARGGKASHGHNARAASGPASHGGHSSSAYPVVGKHYVSNGVAPNVARPYRSSNNLRPDGGAGSISIHSPFDPTSTEPPHLAGFSHSHAQEGHYGSPQGTGFGVLGTGGMYGGSGYRPDAVAGAHDYSAEASPVSSERRSSLPLPQLFGKGPTNSVLNPNNPEFVPSASSANASPIMLKETIGGAAQSTKAGPPSAFAPPMLNSTPPGGSSMEHSPTSSSRFAFPLARHGGAGPLTKPVMTSTAPSPIGSDRVPASVSEGAPSNSVIGSQLFPPGSNSANSFNRSSPLLSSVVPTASGSSPLLYGSSSPRFASAPFTKTEDPPTSQEGAFATSKFGPLDYDPSLEDFGPGLNLGAGSIFGPSTSSASAPLPFGGGAYSSIFRAPNAWTSPGAPATSSVGSGGSAVGSSLVSTSSATGPSLWAAPSPPLGGGLSVPGATSDIWSPPSLSGPTAPSSLRTKLSLGDFSQQRSSLVPIGASHDIGADFGPGTGIGGSSSLLSDGPGGGGLRSGGGGRLMNMSAPVSPTSPHRPEHSMAQPSSGLGHNNPAHSTGENFDVEILAEIAKTVTAGQTRSDSIVADDVSTTARPSSNSRTQENEAESPPTPSFADVAAAAKTPPPPPSS
ncbi:uncharacterized protein PSFLO_01483 [Pseudozyma flocculosa]|uniref:Uncharacterized protein n=1 Tax=Pseudozyma flocculosa TaxID=84751 RepID=A0A5C3EVD4_9BASI|nr:uncharacterized protein PSFLO_01483 [Pseudozyma flocculosa]